MPQERRLAAILHADVVGYSRLMAEDEAATIRTLTDYREEIAMLVRQHRGRVVDSPGDNRLVPGSNPGGPTTKSRFGSVCFSETLSVACRWPPSWGRSTCTSAESARRA